MTPTPAGSSRGRALVAAAGVLAAIGFVLVIYAMPTSDRPAPSTPPSHSSETRTAQARSSSETVQPTGEGPVPAEGFGSDEVSPAPATSTAPASAPAQEVLPEPGAGPRADPLVQRALERAITADLPPDDERQLTALGRAVWMAEITGAGRLRWPDYFPDPRVGTAYTQVRIQGLIARRGTERPGDAVVHLVWAGADPSGTFLDGRTATLHFRHVGKAWTPQR